ncbi:MAG TPA: hemerythrin domain-containing protein [Gammaproteobacteria bacterium]
MNATDMLREDHDKVRELLSQLSSTTNRAAKKRSELLQKLKKEVLIHTQIEEEIFYPAFRDSKAEESKRLFYEAKEEHRAVDELVLPDVETTEPSSEEFAGRIKVLKDMIEHHAEEEEKEIFPKAKKALGKEELEELGERMAERKQELEQQF